MDLGDFLVGLGLLMLGVIGTIKGSKAYTNKTKDTTANDFGFLSSSILAIIFGLWIIIKAL